MNRRLFLSVIVAAFGCSTTPTHVGEPIKTTDGDEYSIKATPNGFIAAGHYSEYQFIRNSRRGFIGCARLMNDGARDYSRSLDKTVQYPQWDEIEIVDHGRDIITAIMNVNCRHAYKFLEPEINP